MSLYILCVGECEMRCCTAVSTWVRLLYELNVMHLLYVMLNSTNWMMYFCAAAFESSGRIIFCSLHFHVIVLGNIFLGFVSKLTLYWMLEGTKSRFCKVRVKKIVMGYEERGLVDEFIVGFNQWFYEMCEGSKW